jgi:hypothetical protein
MLSAFALPRLPRGGNAVCLHIFPKVNRTDERLLAGGRAAGGGNTGSDPRVCLSMQGVRPPRLLRGRMALEGALSPRLEWGNPSGGLNGDPLFRSFTPEDRPFPGEFLAGAGKDAFSVPRTDERLLAGGRGVRMRGFEEKKRLERCFPILGSDPYVPFPIPGSDPCGRLPTRRPRPHGRRGSAPGAGRERMIPAPL